MVCLQSGVGMEGRSSTSRERREGRVKEEEARSALAPTMWPLASPSSFSTSFLDGDEVTGEVMNLDDFLKELQQNETSSRSAASPPVRLSVFQSVGRAQPLTLRPATPEPRPEPEEPKPVIPKASVRPQLREVAPPAKRRATASATAVREEAVREDERVERVEGVKKERMLSGEGGMEGEGGVEGEGGFTSTVCVNFSADDLRLATIPGQEGDFDPATRRFSEDELKPQPIIRKRRKQFVPDEMKNNKYWQKRNINNEAAKRSREARRLKENQIAMRARFLEEENNVLKSQVEELKQENVELRQGMELLEERIAKVAAQRR